MVSETIAFAAGGTGGHVSPAVALAEAFHSHYPHYSCINLQGSRKEESLISFPGERFDIQPPRLRLFRPWQTISGLMKSLSITAKLFEEKNVKAVVATGGYSSLPSLLYARKQKLPYWVLEQNQIPGRAVKLFRSQAQGVYGPVGCSFSMVEPLGVPVRLDVRRLYREKNKIGKVKVIVCGASQGSTTIDQRIPPLLNKLASSFSFEVVHFPSAHTDQLHYDSHLTWRQIPIGDAFIQELATSDVMIGRAGGSTLAECNALGIAQVLIPLPSAKDNHQWHNAQFQKDSGAAIVLEEKESPEAWLDRLRECLQRDKILNMKTASKKLDRECSAKEIADKIVAQLS